MPTGVFLMQVVNPSTFVLTEKSGAPCLRDAILFRPNRGLADSSSVSSLNIFTDIQQRGFADDPNDTYPDDPRARRVYPSALHCIHPGWQFVAS
jgi:hypothetical protein